MFRNAENGKVMFFNRDYEVMEFGGQREFECTPELLDIKFSYECDKKFLMLRDGTVYVGTIFLLYNDEDAPYTLNKSHLVEYFNKVNEVMWAVVVCRENAYSNGTSTDEQFKKLQALMDRYFITNKNRQS